MHEWIYNPIIKAEILITIEPLIIARININDYETDKLAEMMAQLICNKLNA